MRVQTLRSSGEDVDLLITGLGGQDETIFTPTPDCTTARVMSLTFAFESDMRGLLYWENADGDNQLILPIEGRGTLDFSRFGGLTNPREEGWTGAIGLRVTSKALDQRHFTLALDLSKQRN